MKNYFFLRRPLLALVISILFLLAGVVSMLRLPVAQYPDLVPPAVSVTAVYPGASPDVLCALVAAPLERALNGLADVQYMQSNCAASGVMSLTVTFNQGMSAEVIESRVNSKVQGVVGSLPDDVQRMGVSVNAGSGSFLQIVTLSSPDERYDSLFLNNYAAANLVERLQRVAGVSMAGLLIAEEYALRIWIDPARLAANDFTPQDIAAAVREQNAQYAAGTLGLEPAPPEARMTWLTNTGKGMSSVDDFKNIVLRVNHGDDIVRLGDVARITLGAADYSVKSRLNGKNVAGISIVLAPGANALATARGVREVMLEASADFPPGMEYAVPYDITRFVDISIDEVKHTLLEAVVLVAAVIFLFLGSLRATLIPCVAVPIAIIGTFAGMWLLHFSINTLTLFGMVLAIGIVVDDAIVVLENTERLMRAEGLSAAAAVSKAMSEVAGPVISIVLALIAVFVPVSFMGGMTGEMFRQFGITIALSVFISGIVALSLTPLLCAALIRHQAGHTPNVFFRAFERVFDQISAVYLAACAALIRHPVMSFAILLAVGAANVVLFRTVPQGLTPDEDQGYVIAAAILPDGASMPRTDAGLSALSEKLLRNPDVDAVLSIAGQDLLGGAGNVGNRGAAFVMLKPWETRRAAAQSSFAIADSVRALGNDIADGVFVAFNPPSIVGLGTVGGLEGWLQNKSGASAAEMADVCARFGQSAADRKEVIGAGCSLSLSAPTVTLSLDADRAKLMGVQVADAYQTLAIYLSGAYINDFTQNGRILKVNMQSEARFRAQPDDLDHYFVRNDRGVMIPLNNLIRRRMGGSAPLLNRFDGQPAVQISGQAAPGYSNLDAMNALEEVARAALPAGYALAWSGTSYQEKTGGGTNYAALGLGLLLVFMILAVQFEHLLPPLISVLSVPFAVCGALLTALLAGFDNGVYVQVALVTLIGLSIKNAILIVEFAWMEMRAGKNATEAALTAAQKRFRPIVMTSLAFILGCTPLVLSSGAGAASRHVLGGSIIGGMIAATCVAPLFIPAFFALLAKHIKTGNHAV
ncbi:MAG: efflux RND transporter permease subunit [Candidatus Accumulibacter sp.]|jgi:hydrophobe/amphiphile efflux-1 (HAE1) family protein|nr:efflux RND transporter permease subunit [Accumulibacter sp.]